MKNMHGSEDLPFIVGIGASAGGLSAYTELLHRFPADIDLAVVIVQHLDPEEESLLRELLARTTAIPIETAKDGELVQANHVYVSPPNHKLTIAQGHLQLEKFEQRQSSIKTIDLFFQSLAADQQHKGIAIILSGSNNDGAVGVLAIKNAGGITFSQTPATAEFPDMPNASIATGQVDFILSPAEIAEELVKISQSSELYELIPTQRAQYSSASQKNDLSSIFQLLIKHTDVNFSHYKSNTFQRRLARRMVMNKLPDLADYVQYLTETPSEIQALYRDVLITVTNFFRDADFFAVLNERVFPRLFKQASAASSIRIWVPGCASGEEAYSLAICLLEYLDSQIITPTIQIFGTDICEQAIDIARAGIYQEDDLKDVSPERIRRFFVAVEEGYQIKKSVREQCIFARQDLSSDPPFSDLDVVSCRNVLIYFKSPLQKHCLSLFHYSLNPNGFLMLGSSENIGSDQFKVFDTHTKIYTRKAVPSRLNFDFVTRHDHFTKTLSQPENNFRVQQSLTRPNVQQCADQILLNRYVPVGVVVNKALDILQFRGDTSPYLRLPQGEPSFNLLKIIQPNMLVEVRGAIEEAKQQNVAVKRQRLWIGDEQTEQVEVEVIPFQISMSQDRCFLVLFERSSTEEFLLKDKHEPEAIMKPVNLDPEIDRLQAELATVRQELLDTQIVLQLTIDEQQTSSERLIVANEEILSSNEELKSTNEELQTAKEEIQSANEELKTTNDELKNRNIEASRANDDLLNLLNNINIPILMLSSDLCIRRFTPLVRSIFNVIPSDIGRPIRDIRFNVDVPELEALILEVLATLKTIELDVQDQDGQSCLLRILPYRTLENQIDGVVLMLVNIHNLKATEQELRESRSELEIEMLAMNQVQNLSRRLFKSFDLKSALKEVLDVAIGIQFGEMGCVHLYNPTSDLLEIFAQQGFEQEFLDYFSEVPATQDSSYRRAFNSAQRILIEDIDLEPGLNPQRQIAAKTGFRGVLSIPLINRERNLLGILSIHFCQPYIPPERELQMLEHYARQASEFIDQIREQEKLRQLESKELAALDANVRKDEFLSVLSHELRTPLTAILGWAQLMEQEKLDVSDFNRGIVSIKDSALAQLRLVEDLLDTSRITQARFLLNKQPTSLTDLLQEAFTLMQPQATQKDIQIETVLESSSEQLMIDPDRMGQVFSNLLSNAIKFTPKGGCITCQVTDLSSQVQVQVSDTGQGIASHILPLIFERFQQADSSKTRREGGLGLGLFIVRSSVEAHGGTIEVESLGEGQGTTFTITLPKVTATSAQETDSTTSTTVTSFAGIRVLVVEDDETILLLLTTFLNKLGVILSTAQSGSKALEIITNQPLDLLISDIGLPDFNGFSLMKRVRSLSSEQGGDVPAIALSGYVSSGDIQTATAAGFQHHLPKPIDFDELREAMSSLITI